MRETPVEVTAKYLHGVTWPARKAVVLEALERNGAPSDVLEIVRTNRLERFVAPSDVQQALWWEA